MRMTTVLFGAAALLPLAATARAGEPPITNDVQVDFETRGRFGLVDGHLQTPRGGAPGSTSPNRPTLKELGVEHAWAVGGRLRVFWRRWVAVAQFDRIDLGGSATLTQDLVSQAETFPIGTRMASDSALLHASLSIRHRFPICTDSGTITLSPGLGYSMFGFRYKTRGSNGSGTERNYTDYPPHLDLGVAWRPRTRGPIWLSAEVSRTITALQPTTTTDILSTRLRLHHDLGARGTSSIFFGVGYQHLAKKDQQPVPNRPDIDFGPWFELGATLRF